jgi:hypothetical protein
MNSLITGIKSLFVSSEDTVLQDNKQNSIEHDEEHSDEEHSDEEHIKERDEELQSEDEENILKIVKGYSLILNFLANQQKLYSTENKTVYLTTGDKLNNITFIPYKFQRSVDQTHIENIRNGIIKSKTMYHPIVMAYIKRTEISVLDGQHRLLAIKQLPLDISSKIQVQIDMLEFEEDSLEVTEVYKRVNTRLEIDQDALNQEHKYIELLYLLKEIFPKCISSKRTSVHHINENELLEMLKKYNILNRYSIEAAASKIETLNLRMKKLINELSLLDRKSCTSKEFYIGIEFPDNLQTI